MAEIETTDIKFVLSYDGASLSFLHRAKVKGIEVLIERGPESLGMMLSQDELTQLVQWLGGSQQPHPYLTMPVVPNVFLTDKVAKRMEHFTAEMPTVQHIVALCCIEFGVTIAEIMSTKKTDLVCLTRRLTYHLIREFTHLSYPEIGRLFSKNHATIIIACRQADQEIAAHKIFQHGGEEIAVYKTIKKLEKIICERIALKDIESNEKREQPTKERHGQADVRPAGRSHREVPDGVLL